jgi:hypothetical protein
LQLHELRAAGGSPNRGTLENENRWLPGTDFMKIEWLAE